MAVSAKTLSTLQKTGQSIYNAQRELVAIAAEQARSVQKALSGSGSAAQADTFFQEWKQSAHLAQQLKEINERLAGVYALATGATPASGEKKKRSRRREFRAGTAGATANGKSSVLRGNNAKLLSFLETLLNRETHAVVKQSRMADGAVIPLGSVAYSVGRLISMSLIEEGPTQGTYKLL